jgi:hypothetical protein
MSPCGSKPIPPRITLLTSTRLFVCLNFKSPNQKELIITIIMEPQNNQMVEFLAHVCRTLVTKKESGILSAVCTSPLLDIHILMYIFETFIKIK